MAATRPLKTSDLIAKYGWQILPYLSNLGPKLLAEAQVLFVDSEHTNALDADDGYHGHSFVNPLASIDYAIDLCTAEERSVILVAPGHNEELAAATIDFDVSDITIIGIGEGTNKPRIDFDNAASSVVIGANNIHLINLTFMPSITDILIGVEIEAAVTGTIIEKCDFAEGEGADDEFILGVDIKAGCSNTKITNCLFRTKAAAAGCTHAVKLTGASDNVIIEKSRFIGNWSTAAIGGDTTLSTDVLIDDVTIKTADSAAGIVMLTGTTGIIRDACIETTSTAVDSMIVADAMSWFNNYGVTADGSAAELIGGGEVAVAVAAALDAAIASTPTGKSLNDILHKDDNFTYDNTTDSLEALSEAIDGIDNTTNLNTAVSQTPTARSIQDILEKDGDGHFDDATDSLEAIADALAAGTGCTTAIEADSLDHLCMEDGDTHVYPENAATDSIIAKILVKADPAVPSEYDNSTDSLEAISDALAAGTGCTTAIEAVDLDHLLKSDGATHVYPENCATDSILAKILVKADPAVPSEFDNSTDSLEAIADSIGTAQADLDILTGDSGVNLLTATQESIDAIEADTAVIEPGAKRIAVKASGDMTGMDSGEVLFTVTGAVLARVCGVAGTQIDSTSGTTTLEVGVAGNTALLCVQDAADHTAFDANFCWTKTVAADGVGAELADEWVVIPGGLDIILTISADDLTQGTMDFYCEWIPLSTNGNVVATT